MASTLARTKTQAHNPEVFPLRTRSENSRLSVSSTHEAIAGLRPRTGEVRLMGEELPAPGMAAQTAMQLAHDVPNP